MNLEQKILITYIVPIYIARGLSQLELLFVEDVSPIFHVGFGFLDKIYIKNFVYMRYIYHCQIEAVWLSSFLSILKILVETFRHNTLNIRGIEHILKWYCLYQKILIWIQKVFTGIWCIFHLCSVTTRVYYLWWFLNMYTSSPYPHQILWWSTIYDYGILMFIKVEY